MYGTAPPTISLQGTSHQPRHCILTCMTALSVLRLRKCLTNCMVVFHPRHYIVTCMTASSVTRQCFTNCMVVFHPRHYIVTCMTASSVIRQCFTNCVTVPHHHPHYSNASYVRCDITFMQLHTFYEVETSIALAI